MKIKKLNDLSLDRKYKLLESAENINTDKINWAQLSKHINEFIFYKKYEDKPNHFLSEVCVKIPERLQVYSNFNEFITCYILEVL